MAKIQDSQTVNCPRCGSSLFLDNEVRTRIIEQRHFAPSRPGPALIVAILAVLAGMAGLAWMYLRH